MKKILIAVSTIGMICAGCSKATDEKIENNRKDITRAKKGFKDVEEGDDDLFDKYTLKDVIWDENEWKDRMEFKDVVKEDEGWKDVDEEDEEEEEEEMEEIIPDEIPDEIPEPDDLYFTPEEKATQNSIDKGEILNVAMVEQKPQFPGGDAEMYKWIASNMVYPQQASKEGASGKVTVSFVIEKDGKISYVKILRGKHPALDREVVRVVRLMPKWNPGKNDGQPVRVQYNLPITFNLR